MNRETGKFELVAILLPARKNSNVYLLIYALQRKQKVAILLPARKNSNFRRQKCLKISTQMMVAILLPARKNSNELVNIIKLMKIYFMSQSYYQLGKIQIMYWEDREIKKEKNRRNPTTS